MLVNIVSLFIIPLLLYSCLINSVLPFLFRWECSRWLLRWQWNTCGYIRIYINQYDNIKCSTGMCHLALVIFTLLQWYSPCCCVYTNQKYIPGTFYYFCPNNNSYRCYKSILIMDMIVVYLFDEMHLIFIYVLKHNFIDEIKTKWPADDGFLYCVS